MKGVENSFSHSFTRCKFTCSYFQFGKRKCWYKWISNGLISFTFNELSTCLNSVMPEQMKQIEKFVISVYDLDDITIDSRYVRLFLIKADLEMQPLL